MQRALWPAWHCPTSLHHCSLGQNSGTSPQSHREFAGKYHVFVLERGNGTGEQVPVLTTPGETGSRRQGAHGAYSPHMHPVC